MCEGIDKGSYDRRDSPQIGGADRARSEQADMVMKVCDCVWLLW